MEDNCAQRKFGFCKILWKIEHFCLMTCTKNWVLCSPEFSVRDQYFTTWMLMLEQKNAGGDSIISATLKRLLDNDSSPEVIRANWKISVLNGKLSERKYSENEHYFEKNACHQVDVLVMDSAMKEFQPFDMDVLYLECQLIVSHDDAKFTTCIEQGIRLLSEDMSKFFLSRKIHDDVSLKIKDKTVPAHKAILHARNPTLAYILETAPEDEGEIDLFLPYINPDAWDKIVAYLYSGDLKTVIGKPSISIYECAIILDISEVLDYYNPDDLTLRSSADPTEFVFLWFVREFESLNEEFILSPTFTEAASGTAWRLRLLPNGAENYSGFVSIFIEIIEGMKPIDICFEFAIKDLKDNLFCYRRVQKSMISAGILGFGDFVRRDYLKANCLLEYGMLRIVIKVQMNTRAPVSSRESSSISAATTNTYEETLELFSEDMAKLFERGKFSNAVILCENRRFKVHKCIFASRSDTLSKIIWDKLKNEDEIDVSNIKPGVLYVILLYIYSGTIPDYGHDCIKDVYENASHFDMYGLMNKCLQMHNQNAFES